MPSLGVLITFLCAIGIGNSADVEVYVEVAGERYTSSRVQAVSLYDWVPFTVGCEPRGSQVSLFHESPASDPDRDKKTLRLLHVGKNAVRGVLLDEEVQKDAGLVCLLYKMLAIPTEDAQVQMQEKTALSMRDGLPVWAERLAGGYWACSLNDTKELHFNIFGISIASIYTQLYILQLHIFSHILQVYCAHECNRIYFCRNYTAA